MPDWNVILIAKAGRHEAAQSTMQRFGRVERSMIGNVLTATIDDPSAFSAQFAALYDNDPAVRGAIEGAVPLEHTFDFDGEEDFAEKVATVVSENWQETLAGKRFQFRTHRRGLVSEVPRKPDPGEAMDDIVDEFGVVGAPLEYDYVTCDFVITLETLHRRAGLSLWTYDDFKRYPFLDFE